MSATTKVAVGTWVHNPATGEIGRVNVGLAESHGRRFEADLWLQPGAAVVGAHVHDHFIERFEVIAGEVGLLLGDEKLLTGAGEPAITVPVGTVHDWWNAGAGITHVRFTVEAAPSAPGRPAARFAESIEVLFSLGTLGRVNAKGRPDLLWLAAIAREYRDVVRFLRPPAVVQAALFGPLVTLARRTGRDPRRPDLHGPAAPCVITGPGEAGLVELLAQPVNARTAHGH
jgi:mannose-6-phosphate isomerase-like protein (cupin superfamily)